MEVQRQPPAHAPAVLGPLMPPLEHMPEAEHQPHVCAESVVHEPQSACLRKSGRSAAERGKTTHELQGSAVSVVHWPKCQPAQVLPEGPELCQQQSR